MHSGITDVPGIRVGHATDLKALTGCTVVLCESGAMGGIAVRGGAASTRGTDMFRPMNLVERVHGVVLTGGSAFGLDSVCGVMEWLEERKVGFFVGMTHVPIVGGAVVFDLGIGDYRVRPDRQMGFSACEAAGGGPVGEGNIGAGTGATVGKLFGMERAMKGGLGTAGVVLEDGLIVGALTAVNAFGDVIDPASGGIIAGARLPGEERFANTARQMMEGSIRPGFGVSQNTTLSVVATNASLTREQAIRVAHVAHNGFARTISPVHTLLDGDTIFVLATGKMEADANRVGIAAVEAVSRSVIRAVEAAESIGGILAMRDMKGA